MIDWLFKTTRTSASMRISGISFLRWLSVRLLINSEDARLMTETLAPVHRLFEAK